MRVRVRGWSALVAVVVSGAATVLAQAPPPFRTGVDIVVVEATVLDRDGAIAARLGPADFAVEIDGRPREIVATDLVRHGNADAASSSETGPEVTSNQQAVAGRTILIVIDHAGLRLEGHGLIEAASRWVGTLGAGDRVGVMALPLPGVNVEFTTDHARVREALAGSGRSPSRCSTASVAASIPSDPNEIKTLARSMKMHSESAVMPFPGVAARRGEGDGRAARAEARRAAVVRLADDRARSGDRDRHRGGRRGTSPDPPAARPCSTVQPLQKFDISDGSIGPRLPSKPWRRERGRQEARMSAAASWSCVMHYEESEIQNVTFVTVHGDIIGDQSRRRLVDHVWALLAEDHARIVLDVSDVRHVDSRGLGELIECFRAAESRGAAVKLLGVNGRLSDLLVITKLVNVFECFDTREAAIASFEPLAVAC